MTILIFYLWYLSTVFVVKPLHFEEVGVQCSLVTNLVTNLSPNLVTNLVITKFGDKFCDEFGDKFSEHPI